MNILIAGGSGFLGKALTKTFITDGHKVFILTRSTKKIKNVVPILWDAKTLNGWSERVNEMDVVIHLTGKSLSTFPWTSATKKSFLDSRLMPGLLLASAIQASVKHPSIFVQSSGINYYTSDVKSTKAMKSLNVDAKINTKQVSQKVTGHFGNNARA